MRFRCIVGDVELGRASGRAGAAGGARPKRGGHEEVHQSSRGGEDAEAPGEAGWLPVRGSYLLPQLRRTRSHGEGDEEGEEGAGPRSPGVARGSVRYQCRTLA